MKTTRFIVRSSVIAALYAALTLVLAPVAYGPVQFRVSEALTILPLFFPEAIPGLFVGCFIANIPSGSAAPQRLLRQSPPGFPKKSASA